MPLAAARWPGCEDTSSGGVPTQRLRRETRAPRLRRGPQRQGFATPLARLRRCAARCCLRGGLPLSNWPLAGAPSGSSTHTYCNRWRTTTAWPCIASCGHMRCRWQDVCHGSDGRPGHDTHGVDTAQDGTIRIDPISQRWADFAPEFVEVPSPAPTRRHTVGGAYVGFSTLDRILVPAGEADLIDLRPAFAPVRNIADRTMPSGHTPMELTFQEPRWGRGRAHIPDYVAAHPPFGRFLLLKACMVGVAEELRAAIRRAAPRTAGARLGCALQAWRAWRDGSASRLQAEVQRVPELSEAVRRAGAGEAEVFRERRFAPTGAGRGCAGHGHARGRATLRPRGAHRSNTSDALGSPQGHVKCAAGGP